MCGKGKSGKSGKSGKAGRKLVVQSDCIEDIGQLQSSYEKDDEDMPTNAGEGDDDDEEVSPSRCAILGNSNAVDGFKFLVLNDTSGDPLPLGSPQNATVDELVVISNDEIFSDVRD
jgi:hypothetical protein